MELAVAIVTGIFALLSSYIGLNVASITKRLKQIDEQLASFKKYSAFRTAIDQEYLAFVQWCYKDGDLKQLASEVVSQIIEVSRRIMDIGFTNTFDPVFENEIRTLGEFLYRRTKELFPNCYDFDILQDKGQIPVITDFIKAIHVLTDDERNGKHARYLTIARDFTVDILKMLNDGYSKCHLERSGESDIEFLRRHS